MNKNNPSKKEINDTHKLKKSQKLTRSSAELLAEYFDSSQSPFEVIGKHLEESQMQFINEMASLEKEFDERMSKKYPYGYGLYKLSLKNSPEFYEKIEKTAHMKSKEYEPDIIDIEIVEIIEAIENETLADAIKAYHNMFIQRKLADRLRKKYGRSKKQPRPTHILIDTADDKELDKLSKEEGLLYEMIEREKLYEQLEKGFKILTTRQKEVIELHYLKKLSKAQVARELDITRQTVDEHVQAAYKKLKKLLPNF